MPGGRPKSDIRERFLAKVKKMESGCHEWQAGLHRDGYGKFCEDGKTIQAHRVAYALFVNPIPSGAWVLHRCDNRKCVNTEHLFIGDAVANIADMDVKQRRGTKSPLTYKDVEEIKILLADRYSQQEIADKFGVHQTAISRVKLGKTTIFKN
jgi:predicted XRE-type DNA-binding protein